MDLLTMQTVTQQLAEIKEILKAFGLENEIQITHVNKMYCNAKRKHFFGYYEGRHCDFFFHVDKIADIKWYKPEVGSIRMGIANPYYTFEYATKSFGNMVYVGDLQK